MKIQPGDWIVGAAGRGVHCAITLEPSDAPDVAGTIATWFLDCPGQSPAWRHYVLSIIHLRPIQGVKPAVIARPGATHEIILVALDPQSNPIPSDVETWTHLRPLNFVGQLTLPSDDQAKIVVETLAKAVIDGILWAEPPLSGQVEPWESQLRQLEAHAAGKHYQ